MPDYELNTERPLWVVHIGNDDRIALRALEEGFVCIGWTDIGDLSGALHQAVRRCRGLRHQSFERFIELPARCWVERRPGHFRRSSASLSTSSPGTVSTRRSGLAPQHPARPDVRMKEDFDDGARYLRLHGSRVRSKAVYGRRSS